MGELSQRKEKILGAVIIEYIALADPVASEQIVQKYPLGVRSATIRSELAEITELGYLEQPHTSAGRKPSDLGYRYFVDQLIQVRQPSSDSKKHILGATSDDETLRDLLQETTKALSRLTQLLAVSTTYRNSKVVVRHVVATALGPERALLVTVLGNGHVENRVVEIPNGTTLEHIGRLNESLAATTAGKTLAQVKGVRPPSSDDPVLSRIYKSVFAQLRNVAAELTQGQVILEGQSYMLVQPEFQRDQESLLTVLKAIEDERTLHDAVEGDGVTIGRENAMEPFRTMSILREKYRVGDEEAGTIAIVGPTRMHYDRAQSMLAFTAQAVSATLTKLLKG